MRFACGSLDLDVVEGIVEGGAGDVSTNEYFAVNDANAMGLPVTAAAATG